MTERTLRLLPLLLLTVLLAFAQSNGTVKGILTDQSGNSAFTFLAPGDYELSAELTGFKRLVRNVRVDIAGTVTVDATLELGQTTEQVSVVSDVQQVETSTSALGRVVEQQLVTSLPLSSRNFTQILALSPGVNASVA